MQPRNLKELYYRELRHLYWVETQLVSLLEAMASSATHVHLAEAFATHAEETRRQRERLDEIFRHHGLKYDGSSCTALSGLLAEAGELLEGAEALGGAVLDAALIAAAQRIEHFEIASYGTLRAHADQLDFVEDLRLIQETLDEEAHSNELLNKLATSGINARAAA